MSEVRTLDGLDSYVDAVCSVVDQKLDPDGTAREVGRLNELLIASGFRMPSEFRQEDPDAPYTRNLVHLDERKRFAVIALVWGPFQETTVHDHLNWGVVSMLEGRCLSVDYDRLDDGSDPQFAELRVRDAGVMETGSVVGLTPPPYTNIHLMSNAGRDTAITLHTYGDPGTRARVFDPVTGNVEIRELVFHNLR